MNRFLHHHAYHAPHHSIMQEVVLVALLDSWSSMKNASIAWDAAHEIL